METSNELLLEIQRLKDALNSSAERSYQLEEDVSNLLTQLKIYRDLKPVAYMYDFVCDGEVVKGWFTTSLNGYAPNELLKVTPLVASLIAVELDCK